ncbi:pyrimidine reductase family protein [Streptomyces sp. SCSIO ZS0520]|uniref:pyrimidine reductase family protein n=1 Tax=Streptomyces sp. SCSIO ZS0520 TaxID=2892996 RepID=UPI0021D8CBC4|nr:pyrimidine reductase family protein [Streptomyces sp. SCSIO ZS0520]
MRRLFPVTDETADRGGGPPPGDREWDPVEIAGAYAYPEGPGPWLRANMVSSLDGAAQHEGRSEALSCKADMRIFGALRGIADAVVVGAETVRKEDYRPARARQVFAPLRAARGQGPAPVIAVVSASLDLDFGRPLFTEAPVPTLLLTGAGAPADRIAAAEAAGVEVVVAGQAVGVDPRRMVTELAERGLTRLLTEGGPRLLGQLVAADVLDELCLTLAPVLTAGDAQRIGGGPSMDVPKRFTLASVIEEAGFLFTRYRRT